MRNAKWIRMLIGAAFASALLPITASASTETGLQPLGIAASSELAASSYGSYYAWEVQDGDTYTAWVEGADGQGIGEYIDFYYPEGTVITDGAIYTGYWKSEDLFFKNSAPSSISVQSGSRREYIDVSTQSNSYGSVLNFTLSEPIICDGTLRVWIEDVRAGWKYTDTCISELYFYGQAAGDYDASQNGSGQDASANTGIATDGGSIVLGSGDTTYNIDEVLRDMGALSDDMLWRWISVPNRIAKEYFDYNDAPADFSLKAADTSPEAKAMILFWYLYMHEEDSRIREEDRGEMFYNVVSKNDAKGILVDIFGIALEADRLTFERGNYADEITDTSYYIFPSGDFGDAGAWYFDRAYSIRIENGRLKVQGTITCYDSSSVSYVPGASYAAYYRFNGSEPLCGWQFDEMAIGDAAIAAADQAAQQKIAEMQ